MAASLPIPVFTNLEELYGNLGTTLDHATRWDHLAQEFESRFGRPPAYIARAPGRVNLIGEHIDYALFGVFPAAVERDILIACAPRAAHPSHTAAPEGLLAPGNVVADNLHQKYARQFFTPIRRPTLGPVGTEDVPDDAVHVEQWHIDIDKQQLRWESYVKAGYYGVLNHYFPPGDKNAHPIPVDLLVTGSVPAGSGLSSSAAMVVASTLAFLAVNGILDGEGRDHTLTKGALVEMAMENEKRVGVNSGGMDQAASVISNANSALYISFFPRLSAEPIPLPGTFNAARTVDAPSAVFICANSLVVSDKLVHSRTRYNLRVVETLAGARVLARRLGLRVGERERITLRAVLARFIGESEGDGEDLNKLKDGLERMIKEVELLKPNNVAEGGELGVTLETMIEWSGLGDAEFKEIYLSWVDVEAQYFQLYKRAKHVFSEALRVLQFREVCLNANTSTREHGSVSSSVLKTLGQLMNASQDSCANSFECSCPELDELTGLAREAGAYGSRLTGAGWGGCTVSLVDESQVDSFIARIKTSYAPYRDLEGEALHEVIFATKPSSGACGELFEIAAS